MTVKYFSAHHLLRTKYMQKNLSKDVHFFSDHMDLKRKIFKNNVIRIHSVLAHNMYSTPVTGTQY